MSGGNGAGICVIYCRWLTHRCGRGYRCHPFGGRGRFSYWH